LLYLHLKQGIERKSGKQTKRVEQKMGGNFRQKLAKNRIYFPNPGMIFPKFGKWSFYSNSILIYFKVFPIQTILLQIKLKGKANLSSPIIELADPGKATTIS
jgi:hypothetical protein